MIFRVIGSEQARVFLPVIVWVSLEGKAWRVVTDSHQEDDDGTEGHHRGDQEEAETVHRASDPAPVVLLLVVVVLVVHVLDDVVRSVHSRLDLSIQLIHHSVTFHWLQG